MLAPVPDDPLARLRATSDLTSAEHQLGNLPEPLALALGQEAPTSVLARLRRDER